MSVMGHGNRGNWAARELKIKSKKFMLVMGDGHLKLNKIIKSQKLKSVDNTVSLNSNKGNLVSVPQESPGQYCVCVGVRLAGDVNETKQTSAITIPPQFITGSIPQNPQT
eukprot:2148494-Amphidinium_carterae.1